jgi:pSer/pThr/pTyr-binding forkhead associated (FHA) protein
MPKIFVFRGRRKEASIDLDKKRFVIGRGDDVDIRLDNPLVSRRHAVIAFEDGRWRVEDLATTNGLWVNSKRVMSADLRIGDTIEIGHHVLVFESPVAYLAAIDTIPAGRGLPSHEESTTFLPPSEVADIQERVKNRMRTHIAFEANGRKQEIPLTRSSYLLGFSDECDVRLPGSPLLAKRVARIERVGGGWAVEALTNLAPVRVNGRKISTKNLRDGDVILVKGVSVWFHGAVVG